jgi:hypothetical protein
VGPRAGLDEVVKRKIPNPCRESNPRTPIVQPVAQRYTTELSRLYKKKGYMTTYILSFETYDKWENKLTCYSV